MQEVPLLDMEDLLSGDTSRHCRFVQQMGDAMRELGFARIKHHSVSLELIDEAYRMSQTFFDQPRPEKLRCFREESCGNRGYVPFGREKAKDSNAVDLKEFYHVGREVDPSHEFYPIYGPNLWPEGLPRLQSVTYALYEQFDRCGQQLLSALAEYLQLPQDFFVPLTRDGNSILRLIHYPAVDESAETTRNGSIRAAAHEDINLMTLLPSATDGGLQILRRSDGQWVDVKEGPGELIVDTGDMFQRLTGNFIRATTHRVLNPMSFGAPNRPRYSMPFFMHCNPSALLDPGAMAPGIAQADSEKPIRAHDFLMDRLRANGVAV